MAKGWLIAAAAALGLWAALAAPASPARAQEQPVVDAPADDLWIDVGLRPALVDWFNQNARADDIARVDHVSLVDMLNEVKVGRRLVVFKSAADAEALMPHIGDQIDIIGYNLESGPGNRPDEQADPIGSILRMREIADRYDKQLAFGPDRSFALSHGVSAAPYVDIFVFQIQRVQTDPATAADFVLPLAEELRLANPEIEVSVQIRTEGDTNALAELVDRLKPALAGVSILTSDETTDVARSLFSTLRSKEATGAGLPPKEPAEPLPTPTAATSPALEPAGAAAAPTPAPLPTLPLPQAIEQPAPAATPVQPPQAVQPEENSLLRTTGILTIGIVVGGLIVATLLYAYQQLGTR